MTDIQARIERAKKEISGNESLLEMLETDAATEMFNWGLAMAGSIAQETEGMDDSSAELATAPRLKALRQSLRAIGNWAVGKYTDADDRAQLKEKLMEQLQLTLGEKAKHISSDDLKTLLDEVDVSGTTPQKLILKLKALIEKTG